MPANAAFNYSDWCTEILRDDDHCQERWKEGVVDNSDVICR
jgi:hypothetical protein